jgi:hypothetical protein
MAQAAWAQDLPIHHHHVEWDEDRGAVGTVNEAGLAVFSCESCGQRYTKIRPDREAVIEMEALWGDIDPENRAIICDGCFDAFLDKIIASESAEGMDPVALAVCQ